MNFHNNEVQKSESACFLNSLCYHSHNVFFQGRAPDKCTKGLLKYHLSKLVHHTHTILYAFPSNPCLSKPRGTNINITKQHRELQKMHNRSHFALYVHGQDGDTSTPLTPLYAHCMGPEDLVSTYLQHIPDSIPTFC